MGMKNIEDPDQFASSLQTTLFLKEDIKRILHECSCFIEFIKRVGEKR